MIFNYALLSECMNCKKKTGALISVCVFFGSNMVV